MRAAVPVWRSLLFVPVHIEKFVAKAHQRGADACILDLEDSVPLAEKSAARAVVIPSARDLAKGGRSDALVRVNGSWDLMADDLEASIHADVRAIVLPKVADADLVQAVAERIEKLEVDRGLAPGHTLLIAQIEDVDALPNLDAIAKSSPRLIGMSLGSEDFSASAGMSPIPETLMWPNQQIVFACRRAGILPFGFPASIADFSDTARFAATIALARQMGFVGAFCVHPSQVSALNQGFAPAPAEVQQARELIAANEAALSEGRGAFQFQGKMVDLPVVLRAQELLRRAELFAGKSQ